jgi:thiol-disulfide isomerase/thioredoxin
MKKLTILFLFVSHFLIAQKNVTISGTVKNFNGKSVKAETLKNSLRFEYILLDTTKLDKNGNFTLKFNIEKPSKIKLKIGEEYTELYAVNGDNISISVDAINFDKSIKYNGSNKEWNQFVASEILNENWNFRYSICKNKESLFLDSLQIFYVSKIKNAETLIPNDVLKAFVLEYIDYTQANIKLMYTYYHKNMNKLEEKPQLSTNYYDFISKLNLNNQKTLNLSLYQQFLGYLSNHYTEELYNKDTSQSYDSLNSIVIQNRFKNFDKEILVSNEIIETLMYGFDVIKADSLLMKNDELLKNSAFKTEITEVRNKVKKYAKGAIAPTFSYPDMNGKMVSLSDFKGKIVYLDVWASWCGPCRREIPAAKELEKQMHGKDVVFLCVSVDGDEAAWKKIVKEKELTGVHIHSKGDFNSEMTKLYDIRSIPTYIIIDRNGKIWKMGAERPSGKAKEELEEALKN